MYAQTNQEVCGDRLGGQHPAGRMGNLNSGKFTGEICAEGEVSRQITLLGGCVEEMERALMQLAAKISPVVRLEPDPATESTANPASTTVGIRIAAISSELGNLTRQVRFITERVDL